MTRFGVKGWLGAFLLALLTALPIPTAKAGQTYAVLVGISDYNDEQIKDRTHAEADAAAMYDLFTNEQYLGVPKDQVQLLLGSKDNARNSQPATRENILKSVKWLAEKAGKDDMVIFGFYGQGGSIGERGTRTCYFAADSTLKNRNKTAVASADIGQEFDKLKSKKVCVFLDINFKGFNPGKESIPEPSLGEHPYQEFLGDDKSVEHNPLPGRAIFLATNGLITAPDLKDHGLFTTAVLAGLKGKADKFGDEADGLITVTELRTYLNDAIPDLKREHNKVEKDPRKNTAHFVLVGRSSRFALTKNPKVIKDALETLAKFESFAEKNRFSEELKAEGQRFLREVPKLKAHRKLRKEYQKLVKGEITPNQLLAARREIYESMRLPRSVATKYAAIVMEAIGEIEDDYFKEVSTGDMVKWAIKGVYESIDEPIPASVSRQLQNVNTMRDSDLALLLRDVRFGLGKREDLDEHKDIDLTLIRMLSRLDPYTTYIDPEAVKRFEIDYRGHFTGIGVQIRKDAATDMLQIVSPIPGGPSYRKGLMAGDLIAEVHRNVDSDGNRLEKTEVLYTKDMELSDAVKKILGKEDTDVKLKIIREGVDKPFFITITRSRIELESVLGHKRKKDDSWDYMLDPKTKIGYVRLSNFAQTTTRDLAQVVWKLKQQGMKGFILDLRFNPGGLLTAARDISDLFIDDGLIVSIRPRGRNAYPIKGESAGSMTDFPMVCLINKYSASASEIVSACLQDYGRAIIVGERSYGKGSVQNIRDLDGGQLKMTTATFWRPSGKNLNKSSTKGKDDEEWGVKPNKGFLVELTRKERDDLAEHQRNSEIIQRKDKPMKESDFKDRQLDTALKYLQETITGATRK